MTIQQLKYIVALDNYKQFVVAAEKCFVNQSTITIQVKKLEDEMGIQLFDRKSSPLKPTKHGEKILIKARRILQEIAQLKEMVSEEKESMKGEFKIGVIPTLSPYIIPEFGVGFIKNNPDTILHIEEMESNDIIESLKSAKIDVGILVTPLNESELEEVKLYNEPFVFYGEQSDPFFLKKEISVKDLDDLENLWLLKDGHCFKSQVLNICDRPKQEQSIKFQSGSIETLKRMVLKQGGYTLIPQMSINELDLGNIKYFKEPIPVREVSIVTHKSFAKQRLIDSIRKEILNIVPNEFIKNERFARVKWR